MSDMSIGQVARQAGLRPSAIRYYESVGLIPAATRRNGQRVFDCGILDHLAFIHFAKRAGFRVAEIKLLVRGLTRESEPGARWRAAADGKLHELDRQIAALEAKKQVLRNLVKCRCPSLAHFAADLRQAARAG